MTSVVFVTANLDMGGAERHIVTVAPALHDDRFEVSVLCLEGEGALFDVVASRGVTTRCLASGAGPAEVLRSSWRLWRHLRTGRPEVVVTSGFRAGILGRLAARAAGVRVAVSWKHNYGHLGPVGFRERWTERLLSPLTARYLGVCHTQVRYLTDVLGIDPERIGVVYNTVPLTGAGPSPSLERRSVGLSEADLVVGVVAVLREEKDHATLLHAVSELHRRRLGATLVVVGDGPERQRLEDMTAALGLGAHVRFLGQRHDVADLLPLFDVVALASFTVECFPYSILEAMAASRPVVVTSVGGLAEMVEDGRTGRLVPPKAPMAMADALAELLGDRDKAEAFGAAGRARLAERFAFDGVTAAVGHPLDLAAARAGQPERVGP